MKRIPPYRKLRGYAFDPSLSLRLDTVGINEMVYMVPWEEFATVRSVIHQTEKVETPGKNEALIGEYLEIVDYDPSVGRFYETVDLDDPYILAQDGLEPSESNPQFHQQMVYAVAMTTITNFERALGRKIQWARHIAYRTNKGSDGKESKESRNDDVDDDATVWGEGQQDQRNENDGYVRRLRIYPHALREANAFYSPTKKSLLFGYFSSKPADAAIGMRGNLVFTCLSHDIITHEITHAILDGIYPRYNEPTNPDVLAFHEAFADIVALFQHFSFPVVLRHQVAKTRGNLKTENLLGQLAQEFGRGIGKRGSLRDAIGGMNEATGKWEPKEPSATDYQLLTEPHDRGSLLVAAIFEAFANIYQTRTADLLRIATGGTGVLPQGELNPDLVNRLSEEASKVAGQVLSICIRALDYCPPLDITFGDYLRAIITADIDLVPFDNRNYRVAFIEAFRRRGIYPEDIKTLSEESLRHKLEPVQDGDGKRLVNVIGKFLLDYRKEIADKKGRKEVHDTNKEFIAHGSDDTNRGLYHRLGRAFGSSNGFELLTGLAFRRDCEPLGIRISKIMYGTEHEWSPTIEVADLRLVSRTGPQGRQINQVVFSILQRTLVSYDPEKDAFAVRAPKYHEPPTGSEMMFRGGCTIVFDLDTQKIKHVISKPILRFLDPKRAETAEPHYGRIRRQHAFQRVDGPNGFSDFQQYFMGDYNMGALEPFAFVHHH
ncbi:MAG: hypothetical protein U0176_01980 [Bacteroidia bacterium]